MEERRAITASVCRGLLVVLIPLLVYVLPDRYHGSGDSIPAELLPIAIFHGDGFDLKEFADPDRDLPYYFFYRQGRVLSAYPVLPGLLNVPAYGIARVLGVDLYEHRIRLSLITSAILSSFSALFVFLTLEQVTGDPRHAFWFALLYAFGTNAWSNAGIALFQHGASLFFLTAAIFCVSRPDDRAIPWAGLLLALAVCARPTNIVFAAGLTVYVIRFRRRSLVRFLALAAIPAALLAVYSRAYWGSIRQLGQAHALGGFDGNMLRGFAGLLWSPARGLFVFSPVFVFAVAEGIRLIWRRSGDPLLIYLFASAVLLIVPYAKWGNWWGGHSFSYRLVTEVSPVMILLASAGWRSWIRKVSLLRWAFVIAAFLSICTQAIGARQFPSGFNSDIDYEPGRLWNWKETELTMEVEDALAEFGILAHAPGVHHAPRDSNRPDAAAPPYHVWWKWSNSDDTIPGWYDSPVDLQVVRGPLLVDGWAKSPLGEVEVRVILDNGRNVAAPARYPRPDVRAAIPSLGDTSRAGWRVVFPYSPGASDQHEVTVEFRAPDGHVRLLPPLRFRWEPE